MAIKVRGLIASDLANDWSDQAVAFKFALSEATLRHKLAEEGTTVSSLLIDAHMAFALQLPRSSHANITVRGLSDAPINLRCASVTGSP